MGNVIILTTDFHTKGRNFLFFFIKFSLYLNMVLFFVVCTLHSGGKQVHKKPKCTRPTGFFLILVCASEQVIHVSNNKLFHVKLFLLLSLLANANTIISEPQQIVANT